MQHESLPFAGAQIHKLSTAPGLLAPRIQKEHQANMPGFSQVECE